MKTKLVAELVTNLGVSGESLLLVTPAQDDTLYMAARNLPNVDVYSVSQLDPVSLVSFEKIVMTVDSVKLLEERLA
jgi:large subunit ribosomal protein L4